MATKKTKTKNLLLYSDFNCTTGFGNVAKELVDVWAKDKNLNITIYAINDFNQKPYKYLENVMVIPALAVNEDKRDGYGILEFLRILYENDWDVLFCLNDIELFNKYGADLRTCKIEKKKNNKPNFKSIVYFPVDSEPRISDLKILDFFDEVVTYTEYAKQVIKPLTTESNFKKIRVISHGCNTTDFYPFSLEEKIKAKAELLGEENKEAFLIGTVNRNSARKDLATLILGFAQFKHTHNLNAILYLHCNPLDSSGINIIRLCERTGLVLGKDVLVPKNFNENKGVSNEELNKVYNAFDCFFTTTTAEGFGLTVTEAMATKTLVVCPKHTSLTEISNYGENTLNFLFLREAVFINDFEKIRYMCDPTEVANLMGVVYNLPAEGEDVQQVINQKIENAYEKVKGLKWVDIAKQFKVLIDKLTK